MTVSLQPKHKSPSCSLLGLSVPAWGSSPLRELNAALNVSSMTHREKQSRRGGKTNKWDYENAAGHLRSIFFLFFLFLDNTIDSRFLMSQENPLIFCRSAAPRYKVIQGQLESLGGKGTQFTRRDRLLTCSPSDDLAFLSLGP